MRPDIDHADEYVRNTTARAFSVVASGAWYTITSTFLESSVSKQKVMAGSSYRYSYCPTKRYHDGLRSLTASTELGELHCSWPIR